MPHSTFRRVFLIGRFAIKVPQPRFVFRGLCCNRWERELWHRWRPVFQWETLCPILFADPLGLVVVMSRAEQPVTDEEIRAIPLEFPEPTYKVEPKDFGRLNGRVLAVDYGLPLPNEVSEARQYYAKASGGGE
jgi:hypothetical protein